MEHLKCLIIGSGPAGYTAAIYASRANLNPVLYEGMQPGGQLTITDAVENFPGHPEDMSGFDLMELMRKQVEKFNVEIRTKVCVKSDLSNAPYTFTFDDGSQVTADAVIIATGASAKYLGLDDERKYNGQGVSACATCDGFFYRKKLVKHSILPDLHLKFTLLLENLSFVLQKFCRNGWRRMKRLKYCLKPIQKVFMAKTVWKGHTWCIEKVRQTNVIMTCLSMVSSLL